MLRHESSAPARGAARQNVTPFHAATVVAVALVALTFAAAALPGACWAKTYNVDADHSSVTFRVRHLFTEVEGRFTQYKGTLTFDPEKPEATKVDGSIQAASIDTNTKQRDDDLRSANFFDVAKFPDI